MTNNRAFYTTVTAQFLSALADNALLFVAIALLAFLKAPSWHTPLLQEFFVFAYILLAPVVGVFSDALPKGRVMFVANAIKFAGCMAMLTGIDPLYAYGIVGIGAAAYSPAKYGILTELLPPQELVAANSWMEASTVAAIILGSICGGMLVDPKLVPAMLRFAPTLNIVSAPQVGILAVGLMYLLAALVNLYIPRVAIDHRTPRKNPTYLLHDFRHAFALLWRDPQGRVSLAVTTLFWGVGATLRLVVITWSALALKFSLGQATQLTAVVAIGIATGAFFAGRYVLLENAIKVLPAGIAVGFLVISMVFVQHWWTAFIVMFAIGTLGGFFVVPLNALLQHRGHLLMGAGHSIAVQNFNENIGILLLLGAYTLMMKTQININAVITMFGLFVSGSMAVIYRRCRQILPDLAPTKPITVRGAGD
ncbi:MAG: lysophospholipid transporter LplT [Betaproteobacteria bacterium]|nr:lysophospholipid transporter LplT [Betaproteobacteria bacterium]